MDRDAAHAAIVLILTLDDEQPQPSFSDVADDILDAIWPNLAQVWEEGYTQGLSEPDWQTGTGETPNPYESDAAQPP